jgi:predicted DNA-binding protein (MmcQ/YjbR family)
MLISNVPAGFIFYAGVRIAFPLYLWLLYIPMNIELLRDHCLSKKGVEETFPFDNDTLVFKVMGKMFALTSLSEPVSVNLKCNPGYAIELRQQYESVKPGFHMNKQNWNTVAFNMDVNDRLLTSLVDHSYEEVVKGLPKKIRLELEKS